MKKIIIWVFVIMLIAIVGLVFLGYRHVKQSLNTAEWVVYTNNEYGIEFKYPKELRPASERNFEKSIDFVLINAKVDNKQLGSQSRDLTSYPGITIHFIKNDITPITGTEAGDYGKPEQITINGQTAYKKEFRESGERRGYYVFIKHGTTGYHFSTQKFDARMSFKEKAMFDAIIDTIKFK